MKSLIQTAVRPGLLLLLVAAIAVTLIGNSNRYYAFVIGFVMINILWTAGMNLLTGYTGLVPLVYAGIAGISAYGTVYLTMQFHWSFWLATPVATLAAAFVGVLLGLPALRLRGFYFVLSSLVIQTVVSLMFVYFAAFTNGDTGINQIPPIDIPFSGGVVLKGLSFELLLAVVAWLGIVGVWTITTVPFGRRLIAIREDDLLAEALGIDVVRDKILAFFVSSLYAGIGGSLYASFAEFISPRSFDILSSLSIWLMVTFGGRGTIIGPIIATILLAPVPFLLDRYDSLKDVIYGGLIVVVIVIMPNGIYGEILRRIKDRPLWKRITTVLAGGAAE
jgi:branched-chain amino acid transport system permease protein